MKCTSQHVKCLQLRFSVTIKTHFEHDLDQGHFLDCFNSCINTLESDKINNENAFHFMMFIFPVIIISQNTTRYWEYILSMKDKSLNIAF